MFAVYIVKLEYRLLFLCMWACVRGEVIPQSKNQKRISYSCFKLFLCTQWEISTGLSPCTGIQLLHSFPIECSSCLSFFFLSCLSIQVPSRQHNQDYIFLVHSLEWYLSGSLIWNTHGSYRRWRWYVTIGTGFAIYWNVFQLLN